MVTISIIDAERSREMLTTTLANFTEFLLEKNKRYGGSGIFPLGIFCPAKDNRGIESRIDDKLARIKTKTDKSEPLTKNDVVDLAGYLIIFCVKQGWLDFRELID